MNDLSGSGRASGLPRQRFHYLRHACATLRLEQGEELAVVSRILGHASITTTANVYAHLTDAMLGRGADRTDVILGRRTASNIKGYGVGYSPNHRPPENVLRGSFRA